MIMMKEGLSSQNRRKLGLHRKMINNLFYIYALPDEKTRQKLLADIKFYCKEDNIIFKQIALQSLSYDSIAGETEVINHPKYGQIAKRNKPDWIEEKPFLLMIEDLPSFSWEDIDKINLLANFFLPHSQAHTKQMEFTLPKISLLRSHVLITEKDKINKLKSRLSGGTLSILRWIECTCADGYAWDVK